MSSACAASPSERPASPFRLTIAQMLKVVAICAVGCAWLSLARYVPPKLRGNLLPFHLLTLPLVLAVPVLVLVKRGAWKDWLVLLLIFEPFLVLIVVALGATAMFIAYDKRIAVPAALLDVPLLYASRPWLIRLIPKRCPGSGRRALLRDRSADLPDLDVPPDSHRCLRCGALFRRWYRGPWLAAQERHDSSPPRSSEG